MCREDVQLEVSGWGGGSRYAASSWKSRARAGRRFTIVTPHDPTVGSQRTDRSRSSREEASGVPRKNARAWPKPGHGRPTRALHACRHSADSYVFVFTREVVGPRISERSCSSMRLIGPAVFSSRHLHVLSINLG